MIVIVTGTPGTGKTKLAKEISRKSGLKYVDVKEFIRKNKLAFEYDKERKCAVVDEKKLAKELIVLIKKNKNLVIDSHLSHFIPPKYVDLCIVTTCDLKTLAKRLKKRGYSKQKIRENLDAEIFDTCKTEAEENGHDVVIIKTD